MSQLNVRRKIILLLTGITVVLGTVLGVRKYAGMHALLIGISPLGR